MHETSNAYIEAFRSESEAKEILQKICALAPSELTSLHNEIAISKLAAQDAVRLYAMADDIPQLDERITTKNNAYALIHRVFGQLQKLCEAAARIDALNKTSSAVGLARAIIDEATIVAEMTLKLPPEKVTQFRRTLLESFEIVDGPENYSLSNKSTHVGELSSMMDELSSPQPPTFQSNGQSNGRH